MAFISSLASPEDIEKSKLKPNERELLGKNSSAAQKAYEASQNAAAEKDDAKAPAQPDRASKVAKDAADVRRRLREIADGSKATADRLDAARQDLTAELGRAVSRNDSAAIEQISDDLQRSNDAIAAASKQRLTSDRAAVAADNPIHVETLIDLDVRRASIAKEGVAEFSKLIDKAVMPQLNVVLRAPERGNPYEDRSYYRDGKVFLSTNGNHAIVVHELSHALEDASPAILKNSLAFLQRRAAGEDAVSLRRLTKLPYHPNEMAWPDDFFDPYVGKDYRGRASEIMSMGLEFMWRDPMKLAATDPEFFEFIYKAARGVFQ